ncbi:hypothetical protein D3C85_1494910 [compost metagenome]
MAAEVVTAFDLFEVVLGQKFTHRRGLVVTMFKEQPAAAAQMLGRPGNDCPQVIQAVGAGHQCTGGLEAYVTWCGSLAAMYGGLLMIRSKR